MYCKVMPGPPNDSIEFGEKFAPLTVKLCTVNPWGLELGNTLVIDGGDIITLPCSGIVVGELGALLEMLIVPEYGPTPVGEKITLKLPEVDGAMFPMLVDGFVMANGSWVGDIRDDKISCAGI